MSFDVRPGEVHALLGENGAGKSTLIKIMAGVHAPDRGELKVAGNPIRLASPRDARNAGIAVVYQELLLFPQLPWPRIFSSAMRPAGASGSPGTACGLGHAPFSIRSTAPTSMSTASVGTLSVANRQRVEIAKALSQDARLLIWTNRRPPWRKRMSGDCMDVVRRLRERGVAIVYVSHRMPEIFALADRVTVLRDGALVGTCDIGEVDEGRLVSMMVGREIDRLFPKVEAAHGKVMLELDAVSHGGQGPGHFFDRADGRDRRHCGPRGLRPAPNSP